MTTVIINDNYERTINVFGKDEVVEIVTNEKNNTMCADLVTSCKNYKTSLRRFFKALKDFPQFMEWEEDIIESCKSGYFQVIDKLTGVGFKVESYDDCFYIYLNVEKQ